MPVIDVTELRKSYGSFRALLGITFSVDRGEILGFLGPNGAGKSTTMKILTGSLNPSGGRAFVAGHDVLREGLAARRHLGYLPENNPLYDDLSVKDFLGFCGRLRGMSGRRLKTAIRAVVDQTDLWPKFKAGIKTLSKGYRQRVGIAQALLHQPAILILDEPTVGLDPNQVLGVRALIRNVGRERTVILCSHILSEVEAVCDRVVIIHRGQIVGDGTPRDLAGSLPGKSYFELTVNRRAGDPLGVLRGVPGLDDLEVVAEQEQHLTVRFETDAALNASQAVAALSSADFSIESLIPRQATLEDVFRAVTREGEAQAS